MQHLQFIISICLFSWVFFSPICVSSCLTLSCLCLVSFTLCYCSLWWLHSGYLQKLSGYSSLTSPLVWLSSRVKSFQHQNYYPRPKCFISHPEVSTTWWTSWGGIPHKRQQFCYFSKQEPIYGDECCLMELSKWNLSKDGKSVLQNQRPPALMSIFVLPWYAHVGCQAEGSMQDTGHLQNRKGWEKSEGLTCLVKEAGVRNKMPFFRGGGGKERFQLWKVMCSCYSIEVIIISPQVD